MNDGQAGPLEIERDGTKYIRGNPTLRLICTRHRRTISWSQAWRDEGPQRSARIYGNARIEDDKLCVLGNADSRTRKLGVEIHPAGEEMLQEARSRIDLRTGERVGDPTERTLATAWPAQLFYFPSDRLSENDWIVSIYVPDDEFERLNTSASHNMTLRVQFPAYGEPADLHFGIEFGRNLFLLPNERGARPVWGRCDDITFELDGGPHVSMSEEDDEGRPLTAPDILTRMDARVLEIQKHVKEIRNAALVIAGATFAIALSLYL